MSAGTEQGFYMMGSSGHGAMPGGAFDTSHPTGFSCITVGWFHARTFEIPAWTRSWITRSALRQARTTRFRRPSKWGSNHWVLPQTRRLARTAKALGRRSPSQPSVSDTPSDPEDSCVCSSAMNPQTSYCTPPQSAPWTAYQNPRACR